MGRTVSAAEEWKALVLRSMPAPAWLSPDAPAGDVVLSTRARALRNLSGFPFPHKASKLELEEVSKQILAAMGGVFETYKKVSSAERSYLVGCRLMSPDFACRDHGRALLLDTNRTCSMMINEEDHLRLQFLTPGWTLPQAKRSLDDRLAILAERLPFAWVPDWGYLAASPYNAGSGLRLSTMCHLIGLAGTKRLVTVMKALSSQGIVVRGLFGETSRAIGAFVQVSVPSDSVDIFVGACEYLIREERIARESMPVSDTLNQIAKVRDYAIGSHAISLSDALRVLAWIRLGSVIGLEGSPLSARTVDSWLTTVELRSPMDEHRASIDRASWLRTRLEAC